MGIIETKIKELGIELPPAPVPIGAYIPVLRVENLIYTSGMLPVKDGKLLYNKEIGGIFNNIEYGYEAARLCALNALSAINQVIPIDNIERIIKVTGYINSAKLFTEHPKVINGASDFLVQVFGENGKHVRSAVGVSELPLGASVELEVIAQIRE
jgi:enamine deaminase RidA (YjgF/YER057c/UK114 family)